MSANGVSGAVKLPTIWDQCIDLAEKDGAWVVAKSCGAVATGLEWKKTINGPLSETEANALSGAKVVKAAIGITEFPKLVSEFFKSGYTFVKAPSLCNLKNTFIAGCKIGAPINDAVDVAKKFLILPAPLAKLWGGLGPVTMFFGLGDLAVKKAKDVTADAVNIADSKLYQAKTVVEIKHRSKIVDQASCRMIKNIADLAMAVAYVALAIVLFATFFGLISVAPWIPLTLTTIALAAQIFSKLFGKFVVERMPQHAQKIPNNTLPTKV